MNSKYWRFYLATIAKIAFFASLIGCSFSAFSQQTEIKSAIYYLEDDTGSLTIQDIVSENKQSDFLPVTSENLNFGFTQSVYWLKVEVESFDSGEEHIIQTVYPHLDYIDFYYQCQDSTWCVKRTGDALPFHTRDIEFKNFSFKLDSESQQKQLCFLRIETSGSMNVGLDIWSVRGFIKYILQEQIVFGISLGICMMLLIYALMVAYFIGKKTYWHFSFCILCSILFISALEGYLFRYISLLNFREINNVLLPLVICLLAISFLNFTRRFFHTALETPLLDKILIGFIVLMTIIIILSLFIDYYYLIIITISAGIMVSFFTFFVTIIYRVRLKQWARFMVSGSYIYLIGAFISSLQAFGVVSPSFITLQGFEIGTIIQLLFCLLAMDDKYSIQSKKFNTNSLQGD